MTEQWDGDCPKCGNCNFNDVDHQHDEYESITWLECCDCGKEFSIESKWFLRESHPEEEDEYYY